MAPDNGILRRARMELAYFSGAFRLREREAGGAGVILRFARVRPNRRGRFQPLKSQEVTPAFLDRTIRALKRWRYDIVGIEEACRRAVTLPEHRRFACLTFDGASKDILTHAYPVLARHGVPFTLYLPTAFPDGVGVAWWLALEDIIARESRISLMIDGRERHFGVATLSDKYELFDFLSGWLRKLPPSDLSYAVNDLGRCYAADAAQMSRSTSLDWQDLAKLAADPNVTFGSATVNYSVLSNLRDADAHREMAMGEGGGRERAAAAGPAFRLSVRGPRRVPPSACGDGRGGRLCQRGVDHIGCRRGARTHQPPCTAAHRMGWPRALTADHAGAAVRRDVSAGAADAACARSGRDLGAVGPRHPGDDRHRR